MEIQGSPCTMSGIVLTKTREEIDIGVNRKVTNKLKLTEQRSKTANTMASMLGQKSIAFYSRDRYTFVNLHKSQVCRGERKEAG
jgi:hypothetical protein